MHDSIGIRDPGYGIPPPLLAEMRATSYGEVSP
jgi:hypothetical protein